MKIVSSPPVLALGAATLCTLSMTSPLVSWSHEAVYHLSGEASALFVPVTLDVLVVWVVLAALLTWAGRFRALDWAVWAVLAGLLSVGVAKAWASLQGHPLHRWVVVEAVFWPIALLVLAKLLPNHRGRWILERLRELTAMALVSLSVVGCLVLGELLWFGWQAKNLNPPAVAQQASVVRAAAHSRLIWVVFDELSFEQVYGRRYPGLQLPGFDALAAQSTVFTHVQPAGEYTDVVLPSLWTGAKVDDLRISADGRLHELHASAEGAGAAAGAAAWRRFDPRDTVFEDARERGWRTAVAGWYIPYCRLLQGVLNRCFWVSTIPNAGHMSTGRTLQANAVGPLSAVSAMLPGWARRGLPAALDRTSPARPDEGAVDHIGDYRGLEAATEAYLRDGSLDFLLLHLPVPHPGGIYDRGRGELSTGPSSYVDNLELADKCLRNIRGVLEERGEWDGATVVVMGDHSWRTTLFWRHMDSWTREDEAASHQGAFDDRPAFVVKLPGERVGAEFAGQFAALRTRRLLDAVMDGRVTTAEELAQWASEK